MYVSLCFIVAVSEELETSETVDDPVSKYRALLRGLEEQEEKKKLHDVEMEVSWGVGLKDKTEELVQKKLKEKKDDLTPFEQYLKRRKEKKKQKKDERKKSIQQTNGASGNEYSDDDIPSDIDLNDPYFKEEFQGDFRKRNNSKKKVVSSSEDEQTKQKAAELELLLMNDGTEKNHFSLKSIQEQEEEGKKKHKKKLKKIIKQESKKDDFEVILQETALKLC
ncbi:ESF1 homolog [Cryptotermes secundus]|uniref:ESF1 homolog n=1 Tax=Cryptotermes secundus TaxID=105785 RepID=UPI001454E1EB|nr:ESF1 homolog [Cryptotermes secundus]